MFKLKLGQQSKFYYSITIILFKVDKLHIYSKMKNIYISSFISIKKTFSY